MQENWFVQNVSAVGKHSKLELHMEAQNVGDPQGKRSIKKESIILERKRKN